VELSAARSCSQPGYRWGEDGLAESAMSGANVPGAGSAGMARCVPQERLFWRDQRPGQPRQDVKELYYYLDATPTHAVLEDALQVSAGVFPYSRLIEESSRRDREQPGYELLDTGIFDDDRTSTCLSNMQGFAGDILMRVTAHIAGRILRRCICCHRFVS